MLDNRQNEEWSSENAGISGLSPDKMRAWDPKRASNEKKVLLSIVLLCLLVGVIGVTLFQYYSVTKQAVHLSQGSKTVAEEFSPVFVREASGIAAILSKTDTIQGYRVKDGKFLWQIVIPHSQIYTIEVADVYLYVSAKQQGLFVVLGFSLEQGKQVWRRVVPSFSSHPLIARDGMIYVNTVNGEVQALRASNGLLLWKFASGQNTPFDTFMESIPGAAAIWGSDGQMYILRNTDGKKLLHYAEARSSEHWIPPLSGDMLYTQPEETQLRAFDMRTGIWQQSFTYPQLQTWTIQNDILYITLADGSMQARRGKDNTLLWQSEKYGQAFDGPKVGQGIVSYTTNTMTLIGLRISDGRLIWRKTPEHYKYSTMLDEGVLLLGDEKFIEGIQATTGKVLWRYTTANTMLWYPRVSDGLLFLSQDQHTLDVIRMSDGSLAWHYIGKGF